MLTEKVKTNITLAGYRFGKILEKINDYEKEHKKFINNTRTSWMSAMGDYSLKPIHIPEMPSRSDYQGKLAEDLAKYSIQQTSLETLDLDLSNLPSYKLAIEGDSKFYPERLASEIIELFENHLSCAEPQL